LGEDTGVEGISFYLLKINKTTTTKHDLSINNKNKNKNEEAISSLINIRFCVFVLPKTHKVIN
jgi:hypothetical protein